MLVLVVVVVVVVLVVVVVVVGLPIGLGHVKLHPSAIVERILKVSIEK